MDVAGLGARGLLALAGERRAAADRAEADLLVVAAAWADAHPPESIRRLGAMGPPVQKGFVLVGGWPGSGKTTLARSLATELQLPCLSKDDLKEALMDALGAPHTVEESRRLGRAAADGVLRLARGCPAAVVDSTWFARARPAARALAGPFVEIRTVVDIDTARSRYRARPRDARHLDTERSDDELWGRPVAPLGLGVLIEVDTTTLVDVPALAGSVAHHLSRA